MSTVSEPKAKTLAAKLAKITGELAPIAKTGQNQQQRYNFIEYSEVAAQIRKLIAKYSVMIFPEVDSYDKTEVASGKGARGFHYVLNMKFLLVNGDDTTDQIERKWTCECVDYGDKGINKAITAGEKYFLMRLFNISERGESDADSSTPTLGNAPTFQKPNQDQAPRNNWSKPWDSVKAGRASDKQINYLGDLLRQLGKPQDEIAQVLQQAANATHEEVSTWIDEAKRRLSDGQ